MDAPYRFPNLHGEIYEAVFSLRCNLPTAIARYASYPREEHLRTHAFGDYRPRAMTLADSVYGRKLARFMERGAYTAHFILLFYKWGFISIFYKWGIVLLMYGAICVADGASMSVLQDGHINRDRYTLDAPRLAAKITVEVRYYVLLHGIATEPPHGFAMVRESPRAATRAEIRVISTIQVLFSAIRRFSS